MRETFEFLILTITIYVTHFPIFAQYYISEKTVEFRRLQGYRNGTLGSLLKVSGSVKIFEILHSMMIWEDSDFQQFYRQNHQKFIFKCNTFGGFTYSAPKKMIFSSVFIRENHVSHD